ncbi:unnamed protein product [Protopolystoma xenopodis]|uniref:Uncharacterized protein n=1 Tax=Protopolystoma xenopodis TaxID=117903 RepID=A0A448XAB8_9PLAT|nr:unnamed protein product [Protopolystoma xenopodis]
MHKYISSLNVLLSCLAYYHSDLLIYQPSEDLRDGGKFFPGPTSQDTSNLRLTTALSFPPPSPPTQRMMSSSYMSPLMSAASTMTPQSSSVATTISISIPSRPLPEGLVLPTARAPLEPITTFGQNQQSLESDKTSIKGSSEGIFGTEASCAASVCATVSLSSSSYMASSVSNGTTPCYAFSTSPKTDASIYAADSLERMKLATLREPDEEGNLFRCAYQVFINIMHVPAFSFPYII